MTLDASSPTPETACGPEQASMHARTALWNAANRVGHAIDSGHLDGTDGAAVAAAIRATTPAEFDAACSGTTPREGHR